MSRRQSVKRIEYSKSSKAGSLVALEHYEQAGLMELCEMMRNRWPELELIHSVPNAGKRSPAAAAWLRAEGMRIGVPDLDLPVMRRGYAGLRIEMKRSDGREKDLTDAEKWWLPQLNEQGYLAVWCAGAASAWKIIEWYMQGERTKLACDQERPPL